MTEPVEEQPTEPVEEQDNEPVEEQPTEPVEEQTTEPVEDQPTEPVEEQADEPVEEPPTEPIEEQADEPVEEPSAYPAQSYAGGTAHVRVQVDAPEGAFPEGTTMEVAPNEDSEVLAGIADAVAEDFVEVKSIYAVDIAFHDAEGAEIEPLLPTAVVMSVDAITEAQRALIVHVNDAGVAEIVEQTAAPRTHGDALDLNMELSGAAQSGGQQPVAEQSAAEQLVAEQPVVEPQVVEQPIVEPQVAEQTTAEPSVDTQYEAEPFDDAPDEILPEPVDDAVPETETDLSFEADAFSTYAVVIVETVATRRLDASGENWAVELDYGADAGIPADAALQASEMTGAVAEVFTEQAARVLDVDVDSFTYVKVLDMAIVKDGEALQPQVPVSVSVQLHDIPERVTAEDDLHVVHFSAIPRALDCAVEGETVTFEADGFSAYVIAFRSEQHYPAQFFEARAAGVSVSVDAQEGAFPEGTTMRVKRVMDRDTVSDIREAVAGDFVEVRRVQVVDIAFYDAEGREIEPLLPVSVVMTVTGMKEEQEAVVVHVDDAGAVNVQSSEVQDTPSGSMDVSFNADAFSMYAVVVTETIQTRYIDASGASYLVEVGYGKDAGIPTGAELVVSELTDEDAEAYFSAALEAVENDGNNGENDRNRSEKALKYAKALDISIVADGVEVEPKSPVEVSIKLLDAPDIDEKTDVSVVHFGVEVETIESTVKGESVGFETDGFSVYVVTYTLSTYYKDANGQTFNIEVAYDREAGIPEGAELAVSEITGDDAEDYVARAAEALNVSDSQMTYAKALDIKIVSNGGEVQPQAPVKVSVKLLDAPEEMDNVNVLHFGDEVETVDCALNGDSVEFETDGFSVYLVAYTVDFTYDGFTYNMAGGGEMLLSALFEILGIEADLTTSEAWFSDDLPEGLVELSAIEADGVVMDWNIRSLAPFSTEHTLTVKLANGTKYVIGVTDEQDGQNGSEEKTLIIITADSKEMVYDGREILSQNTYTLEGTLNAGDYINSVKVTGSQMVVGSSDNVPSEAKILNAGGGDVTDNYDIKYINGKLEVKPRPITISAQKIYDGKPLDTKDYTVTDGRLADGHSLEAVTILAYSGDTQVEPPVNAGEYSITLQNARIENSSGIEVTQNYAITLDSSLTISPASVTLTANSASISFGSEPEETSLVAVKENEEIIAYTLSGYTCSVENLEFENVTASSEGGNEPGAYPVNFTGVILEETKDTTGNYIITATVPGQLIILEANADMTLIKKRMIGFNGDLATYRIDVNPHGYSLNHDIVVKDTFSDNQSINYDTVRVYENYDKDDARCEAEDVSYDYSGNTGTFTVPDGRYVTILYTTRVRGNIGQNVTFFNTAVLGRLGDKNEFIGGPSDTVSETQTITPTGSDVTGTGGSITIDLFAYEEDHMEIGLPGAEFRLLDFNLRPMFYSDGTPVTFTTLEASDNSRGRDGYVTIQSDASRGLVIQKNTAYYLEMITTPYRLDNTTNKYVYYKKDDTYYSFLITDESDYTYGGVYSYINGDVLKVRCYPDHAGGVNVTSRFSGNYSLTKDQKNSIKFLLQRANNETGKWDTVESHNYSEFKYGSMNFSTELQEAETYRVIEEGVQSQLEEEGVEESISVTISYQKDDELVHEESNEFLVDPDNKSYSFNFAFTNEYVDHKLTVTVLDEDTGAKLRGGEFEVYNADGDLLSTYTTGRDGAFTIRKNDPITVNEELGRYSTNTLYYALQKSAPEGHILPENNQRIYFYFSEGGWTPENLSGEATDLTNSYNTVVILNGKEKTNVPVIATWGVKGTDAWPVEPAYVVIGLYRAKGQEEWQQVKVAVDESGNVEHNEDGSAKEVENGQPWTLTLSAGNSYDNKTFVKLPAQADSGEYYTYTVKEEGAFDGNDQPVEIHNAASVSVSGSGWYVVSHKPAVDVTVRKDWYSLGAWNETDRTLDADKKIDNTANTSVKVDLYRLAVLPEGNYTRGELLERIGSEAPVRSNLTLSSGGQWSITEESLEQYYIDSEGNIQAWHYCALEKDVLENQEDIYTIPQNGALVINNIQTPPTVTIRLKNSEKTYGDPDVYSFQGKVAEIGSRMDSTVESEDGWYDLTVTGPDANGYYTAKVIKSDDSRYDIKVKPVRSNDEDVQSYPVTLTGEKIQSDYRVVLEGSGTLTINPAAATVTAEKKEKTYGAEDLSLVTITGLKNDDTEDVIKYEVSRESGENVGEYAITVEPRGSYEETPDGKYLQGNYIVTYVPGTLTITPAEVTVQADDKKKTYGDEEELELTATVNETQLQNGDSPKVIKYTLPPIGDEYINVGGYPITVGPAGEEGVDYNPVEGGKYLQGNYIVTYVPGTLTIERAPVTVTVEDAEKVYGTDDPDWDVTIDGLQYTDEDSLIEYHVRRVEGVDVTEDGYEVTPYGEAEQGNYSVEYIPGTLTITKADLYLTADELVRSVTSDDDPRLTASAAGEATDGSWPDQAGFGMDNVTEGTPYTHGTGDAATTLVVTKELRGEAQVPYWTYTYTRGTGDDAINLLTFTLHRESYPESKEGEEYDVKVTDVTSQNYAVYAFNGTLKIMSAVVIYVSQRTEDFVNPSANPDYTYTATLDLINTGLTEYTKESFSMVNGVPTRTFTLPASGSDQIALNIPANASITVTQEVVEDTDSVKYSHYVTTRSIDGDPPVAELSATISDAVSTRWVEFIHNRICLPVKAMLLEEEKEPWVAPDSSGYIPIPDSLYTIDAAFASDYKDNRFELPTDKYYGYTHAALYNGDALVKEFGTDNNGQIRYSDNKWQYRDGASDSWTDMDDGTQLVLFYEAQYVCQVGNTRYYTIGAAVDAINNTTSKAGTIEMLPGSYDMPSDTVTIPSGCSVTMKRTDGGTIQRTGNFCMFDNQGTLILDKITLDGKSISATVPMITNSGTLTVSANAEVRNAKGLNGGVIASSGGVVEINSANITDNYATNGGVVYMTDGTLNLNAPIKGNSAVSGGVVYMTDGTLNIKTTVGDTATGVDAKPNTATNGGAVYMADGTLNLQTANGRLTGNIATENGGAIYAQNGTLNLNDNSSALVDHNSAKNGGAIYTRACEINIARGYIKGNTATENGGAIYSEGTINITGGVIGGDNSGDENSAANGGAIYVHRGSVTTAAVSGSDGGSMKNNHATDNGGAIYASESNVAMSAGSMIKNSAVNNGGAVYLSSGTFSISGNTVIGSDSEYTNANKATNGAGIFVNGGTATFSGGKIKHNIATEGGGVGVSAGTEENPVKLNFSGAPLVSDNLMQITPEKATEIQASENGETVTPVGENSYVFCNVYLDKDSNAIINSPGLNTGANVGVRASEAQKAAHGAAFMPFGSYTGKQNLQLFINDETGMEGAAAANSQIVWSKAITVEVYYNSVAYDNLTSVPGTSARKLQQRYAPTSANPTILQIESDVRKTYGPYSGFSKSTVFDQAFTENKTDYSKNLIRLDWDETQRDWRFVQDVTATADPQTTDGKVYTTGNSTLQLFYGEPIYFTITNNSGDALEECNLSIMGSDVLTQHYGYVSSVDGKMLESVRRLTAEDLKLAQGKSITLMLPGAVDKNYKMTGTLSSSANNLSYQYTDGTTLKDGAASSNKSFNISANTKNSNGGTSSVQFGGNLNICKVGDQPFTSLRAAINHITGNTNTYQEVWFVDVPVGVINADGEKQETNITKTVSVATIEMLRDYTMPEGDRIEKTTLPKNCRILITTAEHGDGDLQYHGTGNATITRGFDGGTMFYVDSNRSLYLTNITIDGGNGGNINDDSVNFSADGGTRGGGLIHSSGYLLIGEGTTLRNSSIVKKGAYYGGAVYSNGSTLDIVGTAENPVIIENCLSEGGGAVALEKTGSQMRAYYCKFENCKSNIDGGAINHKSGTVCDLQYCRFKSTLADIGSGGAVQTEAAKFTVLHCTFEDCTVLNSPNGDASDKNGKQGGAIQQYLSTNNGFSWIEDCTFKHCLCNTLNEGKSYGGAVNLHGGTVLVKNTLFEDCAVVKRGGGLAIRASCKNATITGCSFYDCKTFSKTDKAGNTKLGLQGGGVYFEGTESLTISGKFEGITWTDVWSDEANRTKTEAAKTYTFYGCSAVNKGGAVYTSNAGATLNLNDCTFEGCDSSTESGGAVYTIAGTVNINGGAIRNCKVAENKTGGGIYSSSNATIHITNCEISGCSITGSSSGGGGVYLYNGTTTIDQKESAYSVTQTAYELKRGTDGIYAVTTKSTPDTINILATQKQKIENCQANYGGGIYQNSGTLNLYGGSIESCSAQYGGGIYQKGALNLGNSTGKGTAITGCLAVANGGGVYQNAGTFTMSAGSIENCYSPKGGGVYSKTALTVSGGEINGCEARTVVKNDDGTVSSTPGNNDSSYQGGGIYKNAGDLTLSGDAAIHGSKAYNGAGVYYASTGTLTVSGGTMYGNEAMNNGGGLYVNTGTVTMSGGTIGGGDDNTENKAVNGAGVFVNNSAVIFTMTNGTIGSTTATGKNIATGNGGGLYVNNGTITISGGTIGGNSTTGNGGGLYMNAGTVSMSGGTIGGEGCGNTANYGGGVYVYKGKTFKVNPTGSAVSRITYNHATNGGGGIAIGNDANSRLYFQNNVVVRYNTMGSDNKPCNVYLDQNRNTVIQTSAALSANAYIGVYVIDSQVNAHGLSGLPFATDTSSTNLNRFKNDAKPYLYGVRGSDNLVIWSDFVCRITDASGELLYVSEDGAYLPAYFSKLVGDGSAFKLLETAADPALYSYDDETDTYQPYTTRSYQVQMLVQEYPVTEQIRMANSNTVTLTTALTADVNGYQYKGDVVHPYATIIRAANYKSMISIENGSLTLSDIVLDGGYGNGYTTNQGRGGILYMKDADVTIDTNAILQNSYLSSGVSGGAVFMDHAGGTLTLKGTINNCGFTDDVVDDTFGGGIRVGLGELTIEGGTITGCSAKYGGAVRVDRSMIMNGGKIIGNTATAGGGGISVDKNNAVLTFQGNAVVKDNKKGVDDCNVQLPDTEVGNYNRIIKANGLTGNADIGIYVPGDEGASLFQAHGKEGAIFGTWETDDNLHCFFNDIKPTLRGTKHESEGDENKNIYWMESLLLKVNTIVVSDLVSDHNTVFTYQVRLENSNLTGRYGDMMFNNGVATAKMTNNEGAQTTYLPVTMQNVVYTVTWPQAGEMQQQFTSTAAGKQVNGLIVTGKLGENLANNNPLSEVTYTHERKTQKLTISKTVVGSDDEEMEYDFVLKLLSQVKDGVEYPYKKNNANNETIETGSLEFYNSEADFKLKGGQYIVIESTGAENGKGMPTDLRFKVTEDLGNMSQTAHIRTTVTMDGVVSTGREQIGTLNGDKPTDISFKNEYMDIVCKITDGGGELLYYREGSGGQVAAIFGRLEDAFDRINKGGLQHQNYSSEVRQNLQIHMIVPVYTMAGSATLNSGKSIVLTTASSDVEKSQYPYTGTTGTLAVVYREFTDGSMIVNNGGLTLDDITLDGREYKEAEDPSPVEAKADGGILHVGNNATLIVNSGATLQYATAVSDAGSNKDGNGGAIWLDGDAYLTMDGTIVHCSGTSGGGVYASDDFKQLVVNGTIQNCTASGGNGGAIYAGTGTRTFRINQTARLIDNEAKADGDNTGNGGAVFSGSRLELRGTIGAKDHGNHADNSGGGIYLAGDKILTMYSGSIAYNTAGVNGGGLAAADSGSSITMSGGSIVNNAAGARGGGMHIASTARISGTSTFQSNSAEYGGALFVDGTVNMTKGTMTENTATSAGGAVYVNAGDKHFNMTGGSVTDNSSPEGAISAGDEESVLEFSGNVTVTGNTYDSVKMNVYLGHDSNAIIRTAGLGVNASIGVYVADGDPVSENGEVVDTPLYYDHGIAARNFATYTGTKIDSARLNKFVNDRNDLMGTPGRQTETIGQYFVVWQGLPLMLKVTYDAPNPDNREETISQIVSDTEFTLKNSAGTVIWTDQTDKQGKVVIPWAREETEKGGAASFAPGSIYELHETKAGEAVVRPAGHWTVTIGRDNQVTWSAIQSHDTDVNRTLVISDGYLNQEFGLKNDAEPVLKYDLNGGSWPATKGAAPSNEITIDFSPEDLNKVYPIDVPNPIKSDSVFLGWAEDKDETDLSKMYHTGLENDKKQITFARKSENDKELTLYAIWGDVVCKITDFYDNLLYEKDENENLNPAIYYKLEDGFAAFNTQDFFNKSGKKTNQRKIKMLVKQYELSQGVTLERGKTAILTTASTEDEEYPAYSGVTVSTIKRSFSGESMITNLFNLTLTNITLDGKGTIVDVDGGIVKVDGSSAVLTVSSGATLKNSNVTGNGGAIVADARTTVNLNRGSITGNSATNGGAVYSLGTVKLAGATLSDNTATNGGGIYMESGELKMSGGTIDGHVDLASDTVNATNGGGVYVYNSGKMTMTGGTVYDCTSESGGGVYVAGTLNMSDGTIDGHESLASDTVNATNGGGIYVYNSGTMTMTGGTVYDCASESGGGVYVAGTLNMSDNNASIVANTATSNGGGVYVSNSGTIALSDGNIGATGTGNANKADKGAGIYFDDGAVATLTGGAIAYNTTTGDSGEGGGIYNKADVALNGTVVSNNSAANGGGIYVNDGTLILSGGTIKDCAATANGGAIYNASSKTIETRVGEQNVSGTVIINGGEIKGHDTLPTGTVNAAANGGGVCLMAGTLTMTGGTITGNSATTSGGAVYVANGLSMTMSGGSITGNTANGNDGGAINVGGENVKLYFSGSSEVYNNIVSSGAQKNVVLNENENGIINTVGTGLNEDAHIGIYVVNTQFVDHGEYEDDFGTRATGDNGDNLNCFTNDRNGLYGEVDTARLIRWQSFLCKLTTADENLNGVQLYRKVDNGAGNDLYTPALYNTLTAGFGATKSDNKLYYLNGTEWREYDSSKPINVEMLKNYDADDEVVIVDASRDITFTTAIKFDNDQRDEYFFFTSGNTATLTRNQTEDSMFTVSTGKAFKIYNLIFDGGDSRVTTANVNGGAFNITNVTSATFGDATFSGVTFNNLNATGNGGAICYTGTTGTLTVTDTTVTDCFATGNGGAIYTSAATASLTGSTVNGCVPDATDTTKAITNAANGGGVYVAAGSLTMDSGSIVNCTATDGGAVYVDSGAIMTLTGGIINGNTVATDDESVTPAGAGIYLKENSTLKLSGSPSFGGTGRNGTDADAEIITEKTEDGKTVVVGNFVDEALSDKTNGQKDYTKYRQDIFVAGYEDAGSAANSIVVTGAITSGDGTIWVWAEKQEHYEMLRQFAVFESETVKNGLTAAQLEKTLLAFRNAWDDESTGCGADYLTGQDGDDIGDWKCIYWTGGFDIVFRKIDGDGKPLDGAVFTLYMSNDDHTAILTKKDDDDNDVEVAYQQTPEGGGDKGDATAESKTIASTDAVTIKVNTGTEADPVLMTPDPEVYGEGLVVFKKIPPGVYFIKENTDGDGIVTIESTQTADDGTETTVSKKYRPVEDMYMIDINGKGFYTVYVATLADNGTTTWVEEAPSETLSIGVDVPVALNVSSGTRKVVLRKVESASSPDNPYGYIKDAAFTVYYADKQTVVKLKHTTTTTTFERLEDLKSLNSGAYWMGELPCGTYYIEETTTVSGYVEPRHFFVMEVTDSGVITREISESTANVDLVPDDD